MNLNYHFGKTLEEYLDIKKITALWLSEKMNVSHQAISNYFKAKSPREATVNKILEALGVSFEEFNKVVLDNNNELVGEDYKVKYEAELKKNIELQDLLIKYQQQEIEALKKQTTNRGETSVTETTASN